MKKIFVFAFCISLLQHNFAQSNFDNLDKQLKAAGSDSARGNMLRVMYRGIAISVPDSAVKICLAHKTHFEQTGNRLGIGWTLYGLAAAFRNIGDYQQATEQGLQSLKIFESIKDTLGIINALNITAVVNGDPAISIDYFKKILNYTLLFKDIRTESMAKNNTADSYLRLHQPDSALPYMSAFMEYASATNDAYNLALALGNYGIYYNQKKEYELALPYFHKASEKLLEANDLVNLSEDFNNVAELYFSSKQYDSSLRYAYHAVKVSRQNNFNQSLMDGYNWLYKNYEQLHLGDSAFKY